MHLTQSLEQGFIVVMQLLFKQIIRLKITEEGNSRPLSGFRHDEETLISLLEEQTEIFALKLLRETVSSLRFICKIYTLFVVLDK